jgi:hypothetical protein
MIQRIQSIYLALTALLSLTILKGDFLNFIDKSGTLFKITFNGIVRDTGGKGSEIIEKLLPLSVIIVLIPVISLVTIFLYKKRNIQLLFTLILIIIISGLIVISSLYSLSIISKYGVEFKPGIKMIVPVIMLILSILAYRGIMKDDLLVKSYDRLR